MILRLFIFTCVLAGTSFSQMPLIEPGVSQELAKWRAAHYSDVRYKLNLTLEKMSPVLKGSIEIRLRVSSPHVSKGLTSLSTQVETRPVGSVPSIILDWRRIRGHEEKSTISNVTVNGKAVAIAIMPPANAGGSDKNVPPADGADFNEHLIFRDGVVAGENVIKLDFTSPILTSGSAITRYVDKEDGSEYIYSLFVPSDASSAFPVFDQPDLKARFKLTVGTPYGYGAVISNSQISSLYAFSRDFFEFEETKPISTYVFAFAAGPWERVSSPHVSKGSTLSPGRVEPSLTVGLLTPESSIYVRRSQAAKFKPHAAEVFRLNREAVKYFEQYFDYKFPFPKYDLVLIPEFPFGGMEHAGATFLRESSIIFPQEPTKNDLVSRATLIFHEAAHQWFGDTVTMRWFDDLWLKEGFATFTAYKAMEKIMPEMNAWKVFYERVKQGAYQTDSTKGTTPIYQEIKNLSAAKSAYGAIVYNKAPAFLRQAEFYLGEDKFQTAVRAFLKKHEFGNAGWNDLVDQFVQAELRSLSEELAPTAENQKYKESVAEDIKDWSEKWVKQRGLVTVNTQAVKLRYRDVIPSPEIDGFAIIARNALGEDSQWKQRVTVLSVEENGKRVEASKVVSTQDHFSAKIENKGAVRFFFPNYQDYGYGIFLLDDKSRDYVLKNIQNEKDPFLRSMMWGALWDSVREGELDPREYVELVIRTLSTTPAAKPATPPIQEGSLSAEDESTVALLLGRVGTAMNYYMSEPPASAGGQSRNSTDWPAANAAGSDKSGGKPAFQTATGGVDLRDRVENLLIEKMRNAETLGQRITYYRAFLNVAASENARKVLKDMLNRSVPPAVAGGTDKSIPLKTKDRFDIVMRLLILNDPDAPKLLADLEKTETGDDAKRYAYAAKAGIPMAENKAKYWNDFTNNKEISESWIEAAFGPWNAIRHSELTLPYLQKALQELPNHKRNRKIFFVNGWLGAFIGGQRSEEALNIVNKFLSDNPNLDRDLRLKILENVDLIERAVKIRAKYGRN